MSGSGSNISTQQSHCKLPAVKGCDYDRLVCWALPIHAAAFDVLQASPLTLVPPGRVSFRCLLSTRPSSTTGCRRPSTSPASPALMAQYWCRPAARASRSTRATAPAPNHCPSPPLHRKARAAAERQERCAGQCPRGWQPRPEPPSRPFSAPAAAPVKQALLECFRQLPPAAAAAAIDSLDLRDETALDYALDRARWAVVVRTPSYSHISRRRCNPGTQFWQPLGHRSPSRTSARAPRRAGGSSGGWRSAAGQPALLCACAVLGGRRPAGPPEELRPGRGTGRHCAWRDPRLQS